MICKVFGDDTLYLLYVCSYGTMLIELCFKVGYRYGKEGYKNFVERTK